MALDFLLLWFLEFCAPRERVDVARNWPKKKRIYEEDGVGGQGRMRGKGVGNGGGKVGGRKAEVVFADGKTNGIGK